MPRSLSSRKRTRQNQRRRLRNRARRSALKTTLRSLHARLAQPDAAQRADAFRAFCKAVDQAAAKGTLHRNAAARRKSRMARRVRAATAP